MTGCFEPEGETSGTLCPLKEALTRLLRAFRASDMPLEPSYLSIQSHPTFWIPEGIVCVNGS
jgi:hypothetical protein